MAEVALIYPLCVVVVGLVALALFFLSVCPSITITDSDESWKSVERRPAAPPAPSSKAGHRD